MPSINDYRNKYPSLKALDDSALIDRVAEVQGVSRDDVMAHMGYKPKARGMLSALNDTVIEAGNAVAGGVKSVGDFVAPGNPVSEFIDTNIIKAGEANQSDVVKGEKARYRSEMEAADGIGDEVGATLGYVARNPVQSLAQAAGSFVLPGAAVKGGGMLASMAGAGAKGATRAGLAGGAVAGAALSGGDAAGTAYELVKKAGGTDEQAEAAAREASVLPATIGAAGGLVGAERLLAGAKGFGGGAVSRALKTAGVEGAQEAVEEGVTQHEGQAAAAPYDPTIDPMKGVAGAATMGAVLGGATGGAVSALSGKPADDPKPDPVVSVLAAPSVDAAIQAAADGLTSAKKPAPAELPQMDADDRSEVLGLLQVVNRPGVSPNVARFAQSRMDALLAPYRTIPAGEATEMLPVPDARELTDEERAEYVNAVPFSYRWAVQRGLPQPEVAELLPTGDATEVEPIPAADAFEELPAPEAYEVAPVGEASELLPTPDVAEYDQVPAGEASELDAETIQADDLLARDGEPFTSKTGAQAKAYASGGGQVVAIPDHFGSGIPGYVVRPLVQARPNNTRGTDARDLPRSSNDDQRDLAGSAEQVPGASDGRGADAARSGGAVGLVPAAPGRVDQPAEAPSTGNRPADVVAGAGDADTALTPGSRVTLNGTPYTVTAANSTAVKLQGADGGVKMVARNSKTFQAIQQEPNEAARPQPEAQRAEAAAPAAAPAPAAPAVVPGSTTGTVEADGVGDGADPFTLDKRTLNVRINRLVSAGEATDSISGFMELRKRYMKATGKPSIPPAGTGFVAMYPDGAAVEADGLKPAVRMFGSSGYQLTMAQALAKVKELEADARKRKAAATKAPTAFMRDMDEKAASSSATLARKLREDIKQAVNSYPDARAEYAEARGEVTQPTSGEAAPAPAPEAAPAAAPTPERTPKAQAVKDALAEADDERSARIRATPPAQRTDADLNWAQARDRAARERQQDADRKPSAMKAELLAKIDAAIARAPEEVLPVWKQPTKDQIRTAMVGMKLTNMDRAEQALRTAHDNRVAEASRRIGHVNFSVEGDGQFKVLNSKPYLEEFRRKVAASPGFKAQRPGPLEGPRDGGENGSGSKVAAFDNMVNEGDLEAASDYADAVGLDLDPAKIANATKVLKWRETRPEPAAQPAAEPAAQPAVVENFGEKLPPARRAMAAKLDEELADSDIANRPLSEIWPLAENDAIEDTFAAAVAHAARAEIPAKPRQPYKLKRWVEKVKGVRGLAAHVLSGRLTRERLIEEVKGPRASLKDWASKVLLLEQLPRDQWKRIGAVEERPESFTYKDGKQIPAPMLRLEIDGKAQWLRGDAGIQGDERGTVEGNKAAILALLATAEPEKRMEFEIRGPSSGPYKINKKGDPEYRPLMTFPTVEEARKAINTDYNSLVAAWEAVKARDNITERDLRNAENRARVGKDHRGGKDVSAEQFQETFGFRGGEFGKWVQQGKGDKERQALLNSAYDALMDLSDIVGVPPRAISLNGTLGIAFGSRGSGWASAHFEPSNLVINLTKTRGAGSLAHEWLHALDNYFGRMRRGGEESKFTGDQKQYKAENFITHRPEPLMVRKDRSRHYAPMTLGQLEARRERHKQGTRTGWPPADAYDADQWERDPKTPEGVRPEVEKRFADLVAELNASPMAKRAATLDKGKSDGYWSSTLEMAARAFESFVMARMHESGYHNDFLVNVKKAEEVAKDPARYPYLMAGEIKPISDAFTALFDTIETRTDDAGNVAMFSRSSAKSDTEESSDAVRDRGRIQQSGGQSGARASDESGTSKLEKTAREKAQRQRVLYDKLIDRAMAYDRAADHMANSLRLGNAVDSPANMTGYKPMGADRDDGGWTPIPEALDKYAADVESLRNDPEFAEVAPMVQKARPRVFEHAPAAAAPAAAPAEQAAAILNAAAEPPKGAERLPGVAKDVANAWRILSENDEVFTYAKSDSTDFAEIANNTDAIFAEPEPGTVGADVERAWRIYPTPGGQPDKSKLGYVIHYKGGKVELNVEKFTEGSAGSAAYAAVGNYAFNNGLQFAPDRFGMTQAAIERRLENLISLALKFGSTDFIRLSPSQLKAFKMKWRDGDTAFNTEQMLMASYNALAAKFPEIKDYTYDLETGARKSDVGAMGRDEPGTEGIVARARAAGARAGQRTVARAIFTNTFASEPAGKARRELLGRLGDGNARLLGNNALANSLYSRAPDSRTGVPMADAKAVVATIREALPTAPEIVLHDSVRRAPENLRRLIRQAGADNDVEAVYHDGEIHVFPGNISSIERMQFVVAHHEVRHHGLRSMLGPQMGPAMLRMYASNANLKAAADAKMAAGLADTRILAVEEALADMPVEELQALTGWARIVAAARQWLRQAAAKLRRAGLNVLADAMEPEGWTDNDIAALVQRAENVSRGGAAPFSTGGSTVFQRAYHGTPYRGIERFSTDAIGTGEGAQAYGWGLYFASKREVADFYRRKLSGESDRVFTKDGRTIQSPTELAEAYYQPGRVVRGYSGADKVLEFKRTDGGGWAVKVVGVKANGAPMEFERPRWHATQPDGNALRDVLEEDGWKPSPAGQLYEVEVPEDNELLLWDKPLSEQPPKVREALNTSRWQEFAYRADGEPRNLKGEDLYRAIGEELGASEQAASEALSELGIKGIKYLDGTSRDGRGNGHNYVIFSGDDAAIMGTAFSRRADQTQTPDTRPQAVRAVQTMPRSPLTGRPVFDLMDAAGNRIETQHHAKTADEALENYRERPARQAAARAAAPAPTYAMPEKAAKAEGSNWRRVQGQEFTSLDEDDAYLYHVTSAPAAAGVREQGLVPNAGGMFGGFYANYSAGKVFLTERSGVSYWQEKVGQQLSAAMENPPAVTVLRIPKDKIKAKLLPDTVGTGDAGAPAFYSNEAVFSRAGTAKTTAQRQVTQAVRNTVADMLGNAGAKVSWWDKTLGTQYAKAQKFPAFKRVFDAVQTYLEDTSAMANEAADQAKGILPKLETWKDLRNFGLKPADAQAIAAPIFTGTLTDQKVYSDGELRQQFNLTPEQIGQYRQFRAAVDTSLDQAMAAEALRMLGDKNAALRDLALTDRAALREGIEQFLTQQAIDAGEDVDAQGEDRGEFTLLRDDIADKYQRIDDLKAQGYSPLMRFGKFKVNVTDRDTGETLFFGLYESKTAANAALRDMRADPEFANADFEQGVLSQEQYKLFSAMPLDSLEMFAEAIGAEKSDVYQDFIRLAKSNRSAMKRLLKRKGTAGFSEDVPRVLAAFVTSNARMAAGALNMPTAKEAAQDIRDGDVQDEAIKLLDVVQNPTDTAGAVRALMFVNFIGGSIASAVVNLTQPLTMTLPYLSQFGGGVKAAKRLMAAGEMVAIGKVDDQALRVALKRAETDGIVSPQEIHHLQAQAMGTFGTHPLLQRAAFIWGAPFSLAEQFNRRVSFIAAFNTAREQGIDDPFGFAEKAVVETQGLYSKANAPNLARGTIGAAALTFRQFSIHYLEWMGRMWKSGPDGKKAVALALALLILAAGTDGLPFADDLDDLIDTLGQALGYDMNVKRARREFVAEQLGMGDAAADVMARGLSAVPGVPLDVSIRMSMGNLLPGTGMFLRSNTDKSRDLLEIAGPAGGLLKQYIEAGTKALKGDFGGAVQSALPVAFQNAFKGADMWATGEARDTLGRKVMDADEVDGLMKFIGFQPQSIARESEKIQMIRDSEQLAKNVEGEIASAWARAIVDKDAEGVADARAKLARWNEDNPESPIRIKMQQIIQRARKLREDRASRFITSVAPERRRAVAEALE